MYLIEVKQLCVLIFKKGQSANAECSVLSRNSGQDNY